MRGFEIRRWYEDHASNYLDDFGQGDRFWQPKYFAFPIYDERKLTAKLDDLHLNPVRAGLVTKATDWRWSSARWYESQKCVGVPISWIE